ncbi:MAG: right-handed parallel beta-helix repeat-containing protein [Terracidiphilus sp.]
MNSKPLTQVMAYSQLRAGTFFVNEAYNVLYVWPPAGTDMYTALVEASVRPETLSMQGRRNIVLRGLVFRHARSCINDSGANITGSTNLLIDRVQAVWNNWGGIAVSSSNDVTVQNSVASYNGGVGISGRTIQNALFKFNESDYNNWRGAQAALYDWGMGGTKLMLMRNTTVEDHYSFRNQAQGLWFDTDNKDITINGVNLSQNVLSSLQLEASEGPITLEYSKLCDSGVGVTVVNTENLTVKDNTFYNNGGTNKYQGEIFLGGNPGGRVIYDWLTGEYYDLFTSGTVLSGNTFEDASAGQNVFGTFLSGYDWSHFADTVSGSDNKWHDPTTTYSFKIADGKLVNLAGWRSVTGTDYSSIWGLPSSSPAGGCSVPTPSYTDFSVNVDSDDYAMISGRAVATARVNSFGFGTVNLSVSGLPAGVSASLSRQSLVSGVVTLTMTASKSAATQNVPITLWAYDSIRAHSVTFYVHVAP